MMIYLADLNPETRSLLAVLPEPEARQMLHMAETLMLEVEARNPRARMGCNSAVELACSLVVLVNERKGNP
jgi:hypothetical protein